MTTCCASVGLSIRESLACGKASWLGFPRFDGKVPIKPVQPVKSRKPPGTSEEELENCRAAEQLALRSWTMSQDVVGSREAPCL